MQSNVSSRSSAIRQHDSGAERSHRHCWIGTCGLSRRAGGNRRRQHERGRGVTVLPSELASTSPALQCLCLLIALHLLHFLYGNFITLR